jgi:hypothetical protein
MLGVVRDAETGRRLPGVEVTASRGGLTSPPVVTDAGGRFQLDALPPGTYVVRCATEHAITERAGVRVTGSGPTLLGLYCDARRWQGVRAARPRRIRVFIGSDLDRANCCVDQSPYHLTPGARQPEPRRRR